MIVDSSALVEIVRGEPRQRACVEAIIDADTVFVSAANLLETSIVVDSVRDPVASRRLDDFRREQSIAVAPVTATQVEVARQAYRDFGRGSGHPAKLNFGDCFAYALAKEMGQPLLFVGDDFTHTDIDSAFDFGA